MIFGTLDGAKV